MPANPGQASMVQKRSEGKTFDITQKGRYMLPAVRDRPDNKRVYKKATVRLGSETNRLDSGAKNAESNKKKKHPQRIHPISARSRTRPVHWRMSYMANQSLAR